MTASYRMPAEWEKQHGVWLSWPHQRADWPGKFEPIPWVFTEMIGALAAVGKTGVIIKDAKARAEAMQMLDRANVALHHIEFFELPTNRGWLRDCGPIFVEAKEGKKVERVALDFRFNAWAKYRNWQKDDLVPPVIAKLRKTPTLQPRHKGKRVVLEGGSIDVNGKGTILTTEECLLSDIQCRNPGFTREDYESVFAHYLGAGNVIWLDRGIAGDDTHGHVDDITRFVAADMIITVREKNKKDDNHAPLEENYKRLKKARDAKGKPFTLIDLPMPRAIMFEGQRLPASYANFLISNGRVLVPTFNDINDRLALNIIAEAMPKHEVIGIHALDLVWGLGTIHCLTQQEPA